MTAFVKHRPVLPAASATAADAEAAADAPFAERHHVSRGLRSFVLGQASSSLRRVERSLHYGEQRRPVHCVAFVVTFVQSVLLAWMTTETKSQVCYAVSAALCGALLTFYAWESGAWSAACRWAHDTLLPNGALSELCLAVSIRRQSMAAQTGLVVREVAVGLYTTGTVVCLLLGGNSELSSCAGGAAESRCPMLVSISLTFVLLGTVTLRVAMPRVHLFQLFVTLMLVVLRSSSSVVESDDQRLQRTAGLLLIATSLVSVVTVWIGTSGLWEGLLLMESCQTAFETQAERMETTLPKMVHLVAFENARFKEKHTMMFSGDAFLVNVNVLPLSATEAASCSAEEAWRWRAQVANCVADAYLNRSFLLHSDSGEGSVPATATPAAPGAPSSKRVNAGRLPATASRFCTTGVSGDRLFAIVGDVSLRSTTLHKDAKLLMKISQRVLFSLTRLNPWGRRASILVHRGHTIYGVIGSLTLQSEVFGPAAFEASACSSLCSAGELCATSPVVGLLKSHPSHFVKTGTLTVATNPIPMDVLRVAAVPQPQHHMTTHSNQGSTQLDPRSDSGALAVDSGEVVGASGASVAVLTPHSAPRTAFKKEVRIAVEPIVVVGSASSVESHRGRAGDSKLNSPPTTIAATGHEGGGPALKADHIRALLKMAARRAGSLFPSAGAAPRPATSKESLTSSVAMNGTSSAPRGGNPPQTAAAGPISPQQRHTHNTTVADGDCHFLAYLQRHEDLLVMTSRGPQFIDHGLPGTSKETMEVLFRIFALVRKARRIGGVLLCMWASLTLLTILVISSLRVATSGQRWVVIGLACGASCGDAFLAWWTLYARQMATIASFNDTKLFLVVSIASWSMMVAASVATPVEQRIPSVWTVGLWKLIAFQTSAAHLNCIEEWTAISTAAVLVTIGWLVRSPFQSDSWFAANFVCAMLCVVALGIAVADRHAAIRRTFLRSYYAAKGIHELTRALRLEREAISYTCGATLGHHIQRCLSGSGSNNSSAMSPPINFPKAILIGICLPAWHRFPKALMGVSTGSASLSPSQQHAAWMTDMHHMQRRLDAIAGAFGAERLLCWSAGDGVCYGLVSGHLAMPQLAARKSRGPLVSEKIDRSELAEHVVLQNARFLMEMWACMIKLLDSLQQQQQQSILAKSGGGAPQLVNHGGRSPTTPTPTAMLTPSASVVNGSFDCVSLGRTASAVLDASSVSAANHIAMTKRSAAPMPWIPSASRTSDFTEKSDVHAVMVCGGLAMGLCRCGHRLGVAHAGSAADQLLHLASEMCCGSRPSTMPKSESKASMLLAHSSTVAASPSQTHPSHRLRIGPPLLAAVPEVAQLRSVQGGGGAAATIPLRGPRTLQSRDKLRQYLTAERSCRENSGVPPNSCRAFQGDLDVTVCDAFVDSLPASVSVTTPPTSPNASSQYNLVLTLMFPKPTPVG